MEIVIASDHRGFKIKEEIKKYLSEQGIKFKDFGTDSEERMDYPVVASKVAEEIQKDNNKFGILICGTGIGMTIVANKYKGIRCANCCTEDMARFARTHNNANILALGAELVDVNLAIRILRIFLANNFEEGRHSERLKMIEDIENNNMK